MMTKEEIDIVVRAFRDSTVGICKDRRSGGQEFPPTWAILCRNHPKTGEPLPVQRIVIFIPPDYISKDNVAKCLELIGVVAEPHAIMSFMDAWTVNVPQGGLDEYMKNYKGASTHPDRVEAVVSVVEWDDGRVWRHQTSYRRDEGTLVWDEPKVEDDASSNEGRFAVMSRIRELLRQPDIKPKAIDLMASAPFDLELL